ncbi:MAG: hypothetical protein ACXWGX_08945 [Usitatibacter sp.]
MNSSSGDTPGVMTRLRRSSISGAKGGAAGAIRAGMAAVSVCFGICSTVLGRRMSLRILWELRERRMTFRALVDAAETNPSVLNLRLRDPSGRPIR